MGGPASWERGRAREKRANIFGFFSFSAGWRRSGTEGDKAIE